MYTIIISSFYKTTWDDSFLCVFKVIIYRSCITLTSHTHHSCRMRTEINVKGSKVTKSSQMYEKNARTSFQRFLRSLKWSITLSCNLFVFVFCFVDFIYLLYFFLYLLFLFFDCCLFVVCLLFCLNLFLLHYPGFVHLMLNVALLMFFICCHFYELHVQSIFTLTALSGQ